LIFFQDSAKKKWELSFRKGLSHRFLKRISRLRQKDCLGFRRKDIFFLIFLQKKKHILQHIFDFF